jgi:hypothetical protein
MIAFDRLKTALCLACAAMALLVLAGYAPDAAAKPPLNPKPQPTAGQPNPAKPEIGPPDPAKPQPGHGKAGVPTPQPTVELKPGEVPAIVFDTPLFNFGRIPAGQEISHDFWFTNTGNGPLEILSAKPS